MKPILIICLIAFSALCQAPGTTERDKLTIREAELSVSEARAAYLQAQMGLNMALQSIGKRLGCEIDVQTADCKPAPAAK